MYNRIFLNIIAIAFMKHAKVTKHFTNEYKVLTVEGLR